MMQARRKRKPTSDPRGFLVLYDFGEEIIPRWYKTDKGAMTEAAKNPWPGRKTHIISVSALLKWHNSGLSELEALMSLEPPTK